MTKTFKGRFTLAGFPWYVWQSSSGDFTAHPVTIGDDVSGLDGSVEIWGHTLAELEESARSAMEAYL